MHRQTHQISWLCPFFFVNTISSSTFYGFLHFFVNDCTPSGKDLGPPCSSQNEFSKMPDLSVCDGDVEKPGIFFIRLLMNLLTPNFSNFHIVGDMSHFNTSKFSMWEQSHFQIDILDEAFNSQRIPRLS